MDYIILSFIAGWVIGLITLAIVVIIFNSNERKSVRKHEQNKEFLPPYTHNLSDFDPKFNNIDEVKKQK